MANLLVLVSYKVLPAHMGGQKGIVLFYEHLKEYHNIYMVLSTDNEVEGARFPVFSLLQANRRMWVNFLKLPSLRRMIKNYKIDCIIAEHSYTGWLALLLKKWTGLPFIIHSHNIEASRFRQMGKRGWKLYHQHEKWIHRQADFSFFKNGEDKEFAVQAYPLEKNRCSVIPYGILPGAEDPDAPGIVRTRYGIHSAYLFYFNGTMDYQPNRKAVEDILEHLLPQLKKRNLDFTVLISGKRLPIELQNRIAVTTGIRYLDFVEDVELFYQAADVFINPVINNSGVKTKIVEALAHHCTVVSMVSGAAGIPKELCGDKMLTVPDGYWTTFATLLAKSLEQPSTKTPPAFFTYFGWQNIAQRAAGHIQATIKHA